MDETVVVAVTPEDHQDDVDARFRDIVARFGEPIQPATGDGGDEITGPDRRDRGSPGEGINARARDAEAPARDAEPADGGAGATGSEHGRDVDGRPPDARGDRSAVDDAPTPGGLGVDVPPPVRVNGPLGPVEPTPWRVHVPPPDPDDEHFVPPRPAPPPGQDAVFWAALVGCVAGPLWFLYAVLTDPYGSRMSLWAAGLLTLCGCALTVWRLPKRSETDPDDDGARV